MGKQTAARLYNALACVITVASHWLDAQTPLGTAAHIVPLAKWLGCIVYHVCMLTEEIL